MFGAQYAADATGVTGKRYIPEPEPTFMEKVKAEITNPETQKLATHVAFFIGAIVLFNNLHKYLN